MTAFWKLFWLLASLGGVAWYIGITWYVAWKGTHDIRHMLKTLRDRDQGPQPPSAEDILRASENNS
jgi:hypothetical protein